MNRVIVAALLLTGCAAQTARPAQPSHGAPARAACARGDREAALPPLAQEASASLVTRLGTGADTYWLTDGQWLAQTPMLVNEDFDFGSALGLGALGAGLAAKNRKDHNAARAEELRERTLPAEGRAALDALRACGEHRYAIAWGANEPGLRVVTDRFDARGKLVATEVRKLEVDAVWWSDEVLAAAPKLEAPAAVPDEG